MLWLEDTFLLAFKNFKAYPLRSALTLIGIVIGIATVIAMMALLNGFQNKLNQDFSMLGSNTFRVERFQMIRFGGGGWSKLWARPILTLADKRAVEEACPSVSAVSASAGFWGQRISTAREETQNNISVMGTTANYIDTAGISLAHGRYFNETEELDGRNVMVVGPEVSDRLFGQDSAIDKTVRLRGKVYTIVGVLNRRGKFLGMFNMDAQVMIPMGVFVSSFGMRRGIALNVQANDAPALWKARDEVERLMRQRRGVKPNQENNFEISTNESMARSLNQLTGVTTAATFAICLLSLLVGGIGILNIMLVSVTERTREIGIRKALGATYKRILAQFAAESAILSSFGGLIGIGLGFSVAAFVRWMFDLYAQVPTWAVLLSLGMAFAVGLIFGLYPAARAASLNPVDAMRVES